MKFCADRVHGDLLVREGHLYNWYLLVFGKRIYRRLPQGSSHSNRSLYVLRHTLFVVRCRTVAALAPPVPFTPPRARAGRRRSGPAAQKGGRRISFTLRPAPLPSRSGAMTPFPGCAAPPTHPKVMRQPPFPALSSRPVDAPDRGGGGRRSGAPGAGAQHRRGRSLHRGRAARRGGEGSRGARPGRDMALWEDRSGRHPGCAQRFPHDSAVATPMWQGAGRNDPPRAPESESDGVRRAPRRARGRWRSSGAPARTDPDDHPAKDSTGHAR